MPATDFYTRKLAEKRGYKNGCLIGQARSHLPEGSTELQPGDRVRVSCGPKDRFGWFVKQKGDRAFVRLKTGNLAIFHMTHVSFDPHAHQLKSLLREIRSGWSEEEFALRAPHLVSGFRWPTAPDTFAEGF